MAHGDQVESLLLRKFKVKLSMYCERQRPPNWVPAGVHTVPGSAGGTGGGGQASHAEDTEGQKTFARASSLSIPQELPLRCPSTAPLPTLQLTRAV